MDNPRVRIHLAYKVYCVVLISVALCAVFIGTFSYYESKKTLDENIGGNLEKIAKTAVLSIDARALNSIRSAKDFSYDTIRRYLLDVKSYNEINTPIYILKKTSKTRAALLITTEPGAMFGTTYRMNPTLKHLLNTGKSGFSSIYTDKNGTWISAYAPVKDQKGTMAGMLELNYHIGQYIEQLRYRLLKIVLLCILGLSIGTFLGIPLLKPILHSINTLGIAASEMEKGNYDYEIKVASSDEIGLLAYAFERMRKGIKGYTEQLKKAWLDEKKTHIESVKALSEAIAIREPHMKGHIERVSRYANLVAEKLKLPESEREAIEYGCMLHDIGKIGVDINILNKPSKLTPSEFEEVKKHPHLGAQIIKGVEFLGKARNAVLYHQERYDGSGYPEGLKGKAIPISARIVALVDAYDAMASERPYKRKFKREEIIASIKDASGKQFDPEVVKAFLAIIDKI